MNINKLIELQDSIPKSISEKQVGEITKELMESEEVIKDIKKQLE